MRPRWWLFGAGRVIAVDSLASRLDMARAQGAEIIDFGAEDPMKTIRDLTGGIGVHRIIDAVGLDAKRPHSGPGAHASAQVGVDPKPAKTRPQEGNWVPGDASSLVLTWSVDAGAKAGTVSIIGVYGENVNSFPVGRAMNKNLTLTMGNCNHRKYIPHLVELVRNGSVARGKILTQVEPMTSAIEAYRAFDKREPGWIKIKLEPRRKTEGRAA